MNITERIALSNAKASYASGMRGFLGQNWRKLSRKLGVCNVPADPAVRAHYQNLAK